MWNLAFWLFKRPINEIKKIKCILLSLKLHNCGSFFLSSAYTISDALPSTWLSQLWKHVSKCNRCDAIFRYRARKKQTHKTWK